MNDMMEDIDQTLRDLEELIYQYDTYVSNINAEKFEYLDMVRDSMETSKVYLELRELVDEMQSGDGDQDDKEQQAKEKQREAQQLMKEQQKRQEEEKSGQGQSGGQQPQDKESGEDGEGGQNQDQEPGDEEDEGNQQNNNGKVPEEDQHGAPAHYDVPPAPDGVCKPLWELIGEENYNKVQRKMAISSQTSLRRDTIVSMNYPYKVNEVRRSAPVVTVRFQDKLWKIAYLPERSEVIVGTS